MFFVCFMFSLYFYESYLKEGTNGKTPVNRFIQGFHSSSHLHYSLLFTFHCLVANFLTKKRDDNIQNGTIQEVWIFISTIYNASGFC